MTRIRASCPACGEVDLRPADVTLHVVKHVEDEVAAGSSYRFACPDCEELVIKPADERIAQLLSTGGVAVEVAGQARSAVPRVELSPHPEQPPAGRALSYDDLIDFHLLLRTDDWFERLRALTS